MKNIPSPAVDDDEILRNLADNINLSNTSYPYLKQQFDIIIKAYLDYSNSAGNIWNIQIPLISKELKVALIKHYNSPPKSINFLDELRKSSPEVCPMCGGFHPTTLDHILPKEKHPVWAIYSKNLVPACKCNTSRGEALKGDITFQARILHPYFDSFLNQRLLTANISYSHNFLFLDASVDFINSNHEEIESIKFHTKNVIVKCGINDFFKGQLNKLVEFPANVIKGLPRKRAISLRTLKATLKDCLDSYDEQCGTPNNWNSILIHGIQNTNGIHQWIVKNHNSKI